jgi:hypothetical protein
MNTRLRETRAIKIKFTGDVQPVEKQSAEPE